MEQGGLMESGFCTVGKDEESAPLTLANVMSYDEMQLAALMGMSVPTHFINSGGRGNQGSPQKAGSFIPQGVYVGLVGARFERKGLMEWQHCVISASQNTAENGYGDAGGNSERAHLLRAWAKLYAPALDGAQSLPLAEEAKEEDLAQLQRSVEPAFLHRRIFKERLRLVIEPFLLDANARAAKANTTAYCHIVGLGLGVWAIHLEQKQLMLQVYHELLHTLPLSAVSDIDFSWFPNCREMNGIRSGATISEGPNAGKITITFSKRDPAQLLERESAHKLLVAQYAWDSNAYPGNEYWSGMLSASGDPAAACCSHIPELQNPDVNVEHVCGANVKVIGGAVHQPTLIKELE